MTLSIPRWVVLVLFLVGVVTVLLVTSSIVTADPNPCAAASTSPKPPINDPFPDIGGTVTENANPPTAIEDATLELFQCDSGTATSQGTTTTDSYGDYLFEDLTPQYYYYVEAKMTGPLSGMSPSDGTDNPSDAVGLGVTVDDLDFMFE